jgi:hypothetical protein
MVEDGLITNIEEQLGCFESIALGEMENVKLMDRTDVKFIIPLHRLPRILEKALANYRILEIKDKRLFRYETLYYDTVSLGLYHKHQSGHLNRYKVRYRNYVDSGSSFFEIKLKNNKGRTVKKRVGKDGYSPYHVDDASSDLLRSFSSIDPLNLSPVLWVNYSRFTLVGINSNERITIDLGLTFKNGEKQKQFPALVIVEVKQEKQGAVSPFLSIMRDQKLKSGGISKYCFGVISLFENIKSNRFKSKVKTIHKIQQQNAPVSHLRYARLV